MLNQVTVIITEAVFQFIAYPSQVTHRGIHLTILSLIYTDTYPEQILNQMWNVLAFNTLQYSLGMQHRMTQYISIFFSIILPSRKKFLDITCHLKISESRTKRPFWTKIEIVPIYNKNGLHTLSKTTSYTLLSELWFSTLESWCVNEYWLLNPELQTCFTKYNYIIASCNNIDIRIIPWISDTCFNQVKICITNTP